MSNVIVKNWTEVYKSLAVWLPVLATALYAALEYSQEAGLIPLAALPVVVAICGALGWIIKQPNLRNKP